MHAIKASVVFLVAAVSAQEATAPAAAAVVRGRVVDENGKPIAGAALGWIGWNEFVDTAAFLAQPPATTGADGVYALPFPTSDRRRLLIAAPGRQACAQWLHDESGSAPDLGDLVLPHGARLVGRVRDEKGSPLAGVRLHVESSLPQRANGRQPPELCAGAISNDKGIFNVPCVPRTGLRLRAEADGYLAESRLVAQESPIDLTLEKVGMVRGRVVDADGKPMKGAYVRPLSVMQTESRGVTAGDDGAFVMTVPCRGRFRLTASSNRPPYLDSSSTVLHGAADDVVVKPWQTPGEAAASVAVEVIDAATRQPLPKFAVSFLSTDPSNVQAALFHGLQGRREYEGKAVVTLSSGRTRGLYIEAPEHGFEVVVVPEDTTAPLVVALGPEAVLRGRVLDAVTGKPMAGVAVRALPKGNTSGSGGSARNAGPLSDANGDYVVRGLRPGDYGVQAHAEGRTASPVAAVTLVAGGEAKLELTVPAPRQAEIEVTGTVPPGPVPMLSFSGGVMSSHGGNGFFQHTLAEPPPLPLLRPGRFRLGPLTPGTRSLQLFVPSRTRVGVGTSVVLGEVDSEAASTTIALPDLTTVLAKGRIELPSDVPTERIVVLATRRSDGNDRWNWWGRSVSTTGIDAGGRFQIDLPQGSYVLQLADLATGIVFHTEAEDTVVGTKELVLQPSIQWLTVVCTPATAGAEVVVQSFHVSLPAPRDGTSAFLDSWGSRGGQQSGSVGGSALAVSRWLVPRGPVSIKALQCFGMLRPGADGWQTQHVAESSVDVDAAAARVVLTIPAPPSDEELLKR